MVLWKKKSNNIGLWQEGENNHAKKLKTKECYYNQVQNLALCSNQPRLKKKEPAR